MSDVSMSEGTIQTGGEKPLRYEVQWPRLPLAVYREIAAHLRQVEGVETGLLSQQSQHFDYDLSQVGGLWIHYAENIDSAGRQRVEQILAYYSNRYGASEE